MRGGNKGRPNESDFAAARRFLYQRVLHLAPPVNEDELGSRRQTVQCSRCQGCGSCVAKCTQKALTLKDGKVALAQPKACIFCHACETVCPEYALKFRYL